MAFNPFHAFRKYSKTMFAVLAIICMLTFVLSSGLGGKNDLLTSNFGDVFGMENKLPEIARLNGKKIDSNQVGSLRSHRLIANTYMNALSNKAEQKIVQRVDARIKDFEPFLRDSVGAITREKAMIDMFQGRITWGAMQQRRADQALMGHIQTLARASERLKEQKKPDDAEALDKFRAMLERELQRMMLQREGMYFAGSINRTEDLLDFLVWKAEADKLDIRLTPDSVAKLIEAEALGEDVKELSPDIEKALKEYYKENFNPNALIESLTDEFRVRIAQEALMGQGTRRDTVPAYVTPYEFRKYYDDMRRAVSVDLLPVNVDDYLAKVTQTPSEADLKALFDKYKKEEWAPNKDHPGFKEPKRIKVEWIAGKADTPHFRQLGQEMAKKSAQAVGAIGGGALAAKNPNDPEGRLEREYQIYKSVDRYKFWGYPIYFQPTNAIHETSVVKPNVYAATVAAALLAKGSGGPTFTPATTLVTQSLLNEMRERVRFGLEGLAVVGAYPTAALGMNDSLAPQPLPLKAVRGQLMERIGSELATSQFAAEFNKLQEEMKKKVKDPKDAKKPEVKAEIDRLVAEFVKKHGLQHGASTELRDQYTLINDPGLKPVKEEYFKEGHNALDKLGQQFASPFYPSDRGRTGMSYEQPPFSPVWLENNAPGARYLDESHTYILTWKTEETDARIPKSLDEVREKVVTAWKQQKARALAEEAANALQKKVRDEGIRDRAKLLDVAKQNKVEPISLDPLSRIILHPAPQPGMGPTYMGPNIPPDKVEYPTTEMLIKILDLRDKPRGETIVVADEPKLHYYVTVLLDVQDPSADEFIKVYARSAPDTSPFSGGSDPLLRQLEYERRANYRREMMLQLRKDVKLTINEEEVNKRDKGGSSSEE